MASFIFLFNYCIYVMLCVIWYHFYNLKNVENTHGGVLLLLKLQVFTKSNPPPWVFFTILKLYKWYKILQRTTYVSILVFCEVVAAPLFVLQSDTTYFSSSNWSKLDFFLTDVTSVLQLASKMCTG